MPTASRPLSTWARRHGRAAIGLVAGLALIGPGPVEAQIPDLLPTSTTTAPPGPTTTLLPPLVPAEPLVPPPPDAGPGPEPAPAPAPTLLPQPGPTTSRTTTFTPTPIPPRTASRATVSSVPRKAAPARPAPAAVPAEEVEEGGLEAEGPSSLPYATDSTGQEDSGDGDGDVDVELGLQASREDQVASLASVAAGLIAAVLLGMVVWVQGQVRRHGQRS